MCPHHGLPSKPATLLVRCRLPSGPERFCARADTSNVPVKTQWLRSAPTQSESAEVSRFCWLTDGRDERAYPGGPVQGSCRVTVRAPQRAQVGQSSVEEEDTRSNSPRIRILVSMSLFLGDRGRAGPTG